MVDRDKIAQRVSEIRTAAEGLRGYAALDAEQFVADLEKVYAARYLFVTAAEAAISLCSHLASRALHKVPEGYAACFGLLVQAGCLEPELGRHMAQIAALRNLLVHRYWDIDDRRVHASLPGDTATLDSFAAAVAARFLAA
jgi:uncharacterized protein YutE (UPF0331/DUF86 family)